MNLNKRRVVGADTNWRSTNKRKSYHSFEENYISSFNLTELLFELIVNNNWNVGNRFFHQIAGAFRSRHPEFEFRFIRIYIFWPNYFLQNS